MRWAQVWVCVERPPPPGGASPGANREAVFLLPGKQASCVWLDRRGLRQGAWSQQVCPQQPSAGRCAWAALPGGPPSGLCGWWEQREPEETLRLASTLPPRAAGGLPAKSHGVSSLLPTPAQPALGSLPPGAQHP